MTIDEGHFITDGNLEKAIDGAYYKGYNKAIDDFVENIKEELNRFEVKNLDACALHYFIDRKAEQLKAGGENEK